MMAILFYLIKKNIIVSIFLLVAMGLTVAFRYASVTQINYENHKLEQEYQQKAAIVQNLEMEIESNMSIAEIAEIKYLAREKRVVYASARMGPQIFTLIRKQSNGKNAQMSGKI